MMRAKAISQVFSLSVSSALLVLLLAVGASDSAKGYNLWSFDWSGDPTLRIANISFPPGIWRSDLENGLGRWNGMWGMWLEYDYSFSSYSSFSLGDGDNNVAFVSAADADGAWGVTWVRHSGSDILEADVMFNADIGWNTGAQDERERDTSRPAFRKVVVHEFGHALGLDHYCSELAVMAQGYAGHVWYGGSATYRHHPTPDDCQGARHIYPYPSNSEIDAALTNFEMHGGCNSHVWRSNSATTTVPAGNTVNVEYTVCNPGNVGINFNLGVYLSTNDYISTYDTYIGGFSYYLPAHYAWERDKTFTIPSSVNSNTYYIGALVDTNNTLPEARETNNRLVFPGRWIVP